eukprot:CAMPEP_0183338454 /NCGR_PEP_ID=MMETSP0164_2-20130417/5743_1 /TAXON_ID=221442 /ORGANISM="Coccolithus pelagicus ssp braarudi, Strain PLY182g" /LENGTH=85 /DNA_ID=CAMNT_0025508307 /DNA_START=28 /DNA_END=282 /DNA_ORIENTATION=-
MGRGSQGDELVAVVYGVDLPREAGRSGVGAVAGCEGDAGVDAGGESAYGAWGWNGRPRGARGHEVGVVAVEDVVAEGRGECAHVV